VDGSCREKVLGALRGNQVPAHGAEMVADVVELESDEQT
jgi:hypothetical protein